MSLVSHLAPSSHHHRGHVGHDFVGGHGHAVLDTERYGPRAQHFPRSPEHVRTFGESSVEAAVVGAGAAAAAGQAEDGVDSRKAKKATCPMG